MNIQIQQSNKVTLRGISMKVTCNVCNSTWGFWLGMDGSYPANWDICRLCEEKKSNLGKEQMKVQNYGYAN